MVGQGLHLVFGLSCAAVGKGEDAASTAAGCRKKGALRMYCCGVE